MLSKLKHIILDIKILRSAYYSILESRFCYVSLAWAQNKNSVENPSKSCSFKVVIHTQVLYLKTQKPFSPLIRLLLKTGFILTNILKVYYHLPSVTGSNSNLNHTLMIQNGQTLVTFKFLFAELKPSSIFNGHKCNICLESLQSCHLNIKFCHLRIKKSEKDTFFNINVTNRLFSCI